MFCSFEVAEPRGHKAQSRTAFRNSVSVPRYKMCTGLCRRPIWGVTATPKPHAKNFLPKKNLDTSLLESNSSMSGEKRLVGDENQLRHAYLRSFELQYITSYFAFTFTSRFYIRDPNEITEKVRFQGSGGGAKSPCPLCR